MTLLLLLACGGLAGVLAGLFGIGGGVLIVPVLVLVLPAAGVPPSRLMHVALASSLATIVLTSVSSTLAHHRRGAVRWPVVMRLVPGVIVGGLAGGAVAHFIPSAALTGLFGVFLLLVAAKLASDYRPPAHRALPGALGLGGVGSVIGAVSSWTGIGGGSLTGPFLMWCNVEPRQAVASAAASGFPIALAGTLGYVVGGWSEPGLPAWSSGYVLWPAVAAIAPASVACAPLGAALAHRLPVARLRQAFALLLAVVAVRLLAF